MKNNNSPHKKSTKKTNQQLVDEVKLLKERLDNRDQEIQSFIESEKDLNLKLHNLQQKDIQLREQLSIKEKKITEINQKITENNTEKSKETVLAKSSSANRNIFVLTFRLRENEYYGHIEHIGSKKTLNFKAIDDKKIVGFISDHLTPEPISEPESLKITGPQEQFVFKIIQDNKVQNKPPFMIQSRIPFELVIEMHLKQEQVEYIPYHIDKYSLNITAHNIKDNSKAEEHALFEPLQKAVSDYENHIDMRPLLKGKYLIDTATCVPAARINKTERFELMVN